jgi:glycine cleavage system H protein
MPELKYSRDHEWLRTEADGTVTIGITEYAQKELGDVVYVELPVVGRQVKQGEDAAVVESVKAASDVKMPIAGTVTAINAELADHPERVNSEPTGGGWFLKLKPTDAKQIDAMMNEQDYMAYIAGLK